MTDLFTHDKDITSCSWIKQSHLGKCSNEKFRTLTLLMAEPSEMQPISHQHWAMLIIIKYLICFDFLQCCFPPFVLTWKSLAVEAYFRRKLQYYEHIDVGDSFLLSWQPLKISGRSFFQFSHFHLQLYKTILEQLLSYAVTFVAKCNNRC